MESVIKVFAVECLKRVMGERVPKRAYDCMFLIIGADPAGKADYEP